MSPRRGFLALVGGTAVTGLVMHRATAAKPTLILPATGMVGRPDAVAGRCTYFPNQLRSFLSIHAGLPDPLFVDWLERGLRSVEACKPGGLIYRAAEADRAAGLDPWRDWA